MVMTPVRMGIVSWTKLFVAMQPTSRLCEESSNWSLWNLITISISTKLWIPKPGKAHATNMKAYWMMP